MSDIRKDVTLGALGYNRNSGQRRCTRIGNWQEEMLFQEHKAKMEESGSIRVPSSLLVAQHDLDMRWETTSRAAFGAGAPTKGKQKPEESDRFESTVRGSFKPPPPKKFEEPKDVAKVISQPKLGESYRIKYAMDSATFDVKTK
ncbi:hypothetical protein ADUPG1_012652 [Aduncisulcus paluster]|uniref:Uncharacterized protein n=1 Tax=Aduncisulcus paluster TaxID=2918883 RepID=A0ABQ5K3W3_9EUKA|nr:hypothetical protein ADUPG1_012652 [Aduncisulcus paluster]|eukprot:gnl/Carplike_NY0171/876_a1205_1710.p1 GENE.gnl/Carplike_NY0171/876_a1205_1710~~gnl/Carplike_NY0171/876_a1205_1710.p1  ORF type:complete len:144 (-),score=39.18 gnl/Carplike_NY0171/876_a1205_1710:238-669(-)